MAMKLTQYQGLEQRLAPQQIMLSALLQLPQLNLEQRIKAELENNPVLELDEDDTEELEIDQKLDEEDENTDEKEENVEDTIDDFSDEEIDWEDILNDEDSFEFKVPIDPNDEHYEAPAVHQSTMAEHLIEQLQVQPLTETERDIAEFLIYNINDDGYLDKDLSLDYVAQSYDSDLETVLKVLNIIQQLDPIGIGARDLRECLIAQLRELDCDAAHLAILILKETYPHFVNKRYEKISSHFNIDMEDVKEALDLIAGLNPKPGEGFSDPNMNYIIPDFMVDKVEEEFVVSLNDWNIPDLRISNTYKQMLKDKKNKPEKETRKFLRQKIESAKWFINSIQQRRMTMLKVMEAIVQKQRDFFDKGPDHLKPMVMKEIAEIIEMDISTVSRVANGKYVQTDYGVFELRSFFTEKMETEDGEAVSNQKIKNALRTVIEDENKSKPLSDEALSKALKEKGYNVARRTVTKYREQMNISVARLRREIS